MMKFQPHVSTIQRTIRTAVRIDAFWERWIVHGIPEQDIADVRSRLETLEDWRERWNAAAKRYMLTAEQLEQQGHFKDAERKFRLASLCFNLLQWIYPERNSDKANGYLECLVAFQKADLLSPIQTRYETIEVDGCPCSGRIRIPTEPKGCIIIVNPIDSTKEELFTYEDDFLEAGYVTISYDGPGQGEAYILKGLKGTRPRWEQFIERVIEWTANQFGGLPIFLFGTSLGASWTLYGSCHPLIRGAAAVSPAVDFDKLRFPSYFLDRLDCTCSLKPENRAIPEYSGLSFQAPTIVFHGLADQMVGTPDMIELYEQISATKKIITYEGEGHCVNHYLGEVRRQSLEWFAKSYEQYEKRVIV